MTDSERLKKVIDSHKMRTNAFGKHIGLKNSQPLYDILKGRNGISKEMADRISATCLNIDAGWLLTGEGEMLKPDAATTEPDRIVEMKDGILNAAEAIAERIIARNPHMEEFAKVADACQRAVAMSETLVASNAKLVEDNSKTLNALIDSLARIETKIDSKGAAGVAKGAVRMGE